MIKFFRKIRQNLLSEGKTGKYFKYAIGEIILVIIGILFALAINEQTKVNDNNDLLNLYFIQLNDELERNINDLNDIKNVTIEMLKELDTLREVLMNKEYDNPKLISKSRFMYTADQFIPNMITYENLKFSGDLKLFNDLNLRNSISNAYYTFNYIKIVEDIDQEFTRAFFKDYFIPNAKLMDMSMSSENFAKDVIFENMVLTRAGLLEQNKNAYESSINSLENLKITFSELQNEN